MAQGSPGAASAAGTGPTVSNPGDAAEVEADRAADAVTRGQPVGPLGSASAPAVSRDAISDIRDLSEGSWLGIVDSDEILRRIARLSPAEKRTLEADKEMVKKVCRELDAAHVLQMFTHLFFDLQWKVRLLQVAGDIDSMSEAQWRWLVANASPSDMESLRRYPYGYALMLQHAPADLVPAWDKLQGLENGTWNGNPTDVRTAVNQLNPDQRRAVRDDAAKMRIILPRAGIAGEQFRTLQYLEVPLKWQVYWLDRVGSLGGLSRNEWSQMLAEAGSQGMAELVGWDAMYQRVSQTCPADILLIVSQQTGQNQRRAGEQAAGAGVAPAPGTPAPGTPVPTPNVFDDRVQLDAMFTALGPAGFLAMATQNPVDVAANYQKIQAAGKVLPTVQGLERGARMGTRTATNLQQWFFTGAATAAEMEKMFEQRFGVTLSGTGSYNHTADRNKDGRPDATLTAWTKPGLEYLWGVCAALPPQSVEQNPRLVHALRDNGRGPGSAYYAGPWQRAEGDVLMGYRNDTELLNQLTATPGDGMYAHEPIYHAGAAGPGSLPVQMPRFNATLRHEIGHAVDAQMGIMDRWRQQQTAGAWAQYGNWTQFVDALIAAGGGMSGHGYSDENLYRRAMIRACDKNVTFAKALTDLGGTAPTADPGGPVSAVWEPVRYRPANSTGPWYRNTWVTLGGRNFHSAYGSEVSLYSFDAAVRQQRMVTSYQWRAPGEWFAEVYQVYYSEQENSPGAAVGGRLRAKDNAAADMIANTVDRGHSPQGMANGTTVNAPGTGGSP